MKNNVRMVKTRSKLMETRKRSARLNTVKSVNSVSRKRTILGTNESVKYESGKIPRVNRLRNRNESSESDLDDEKAERDDPPKNKSREDLKAAVKKPLELSKTKKRSARLKTKKATGLEAKKEAILEKNETKDSESKEIRRKNKLRKSNESKNNDLDKKADTEVLRKINSAKDHKTEDTEPGELSETRKRSPRLKTAEAISSEDRAEASSKKKETKKDKSGEIQRRNRLGRRNELQGNDLDDTRLEADDLGEKNCTEDLETEANKHIEVSETRKKSARLNAGKSKSSEDKKEAILGKEESKKHESGEIRRGNRLRKNNESKENDSDDRKAKADDPRRNESKDSPRTQNKFFKSKQPGFDASRSFLESQKTPTNKNNIENSNNEIRRKERLSYVAKPASLRQTTLSESFNRASKLRSGLRPRMNAKDSKDLSSGIFDNGISPEKRRSLVLLRKIDPKSKTNKELVYRTGVELADEQKINTEDKDSIYDFEFDMNDPEEKPTRNKNMVKRKSTRKPKTIRKKKTNLLTEKNNNEALKVLQQASERNPIPLQTGKISPTDQKLKPLDVEAKNTKEDESQRLQGPVDAPVLVEISENVKENVPIVRISNVKTLRGDKKVDFRPDVSSCQNSPKFNPFRSTQTIFKPRPTVNTRVMMEHSLLNRSLSPIKNHLEQFDPASPWRSPLPTSFSSVKRIVQSTPQAKRRLEGFRSTLGFRIDEKEEDGEFPEAGSASLAKNDTKITPNPLGVKILNEENIQNYNSKIEKREPITNNQETSSSPSKFRMVKKPLGISANYGENKENSGFGDRLYKSPKKGEKLMNIDGSPCLKKRNNPLAAPGEAVDESENMAPNTLMKQSNLNGFLNLDEMPESISINTSHGIFGDGNSTPVVQKQIFKLQTMQASVENFFGFEEDGQDVQVSPVKQFDKKLDTNVKKKSFNRLKRRDLLCTGKQRAARISLGEIKNTLFPRKGKMFEKLQRFEKPNKEKEVELNVEPKTETKSQATDVQSKDILDPVQFSDTFDVLSENGPAEGTEKSTGNDIALFADLEPVHFTKPPRWSYAKKRERQHNWSSDEVSDEENEEKPVLKKRKLTKLNKVEENKIDEWVKSVNETFQEIDEFDLVVEKLP